MRHCITLEAGRAVKDAYRRTCMVDSVRARACGVFEKTNSIVDAFKDGQTRRIEGGMIALAVLEDAIGPERDACATRSLVITLRLFTLSVYRQHGHEDLQTFRERHSSHAATARFLVYVEPARVARGRLREVEAAAPLSFSMTADAGTMLGDVLLLAMQCERSKDRGESAMKWRLCEWSVTNQLARGVTARASSL